MSRINRVLVLFGALLLLSGSAMAFVDYPMQVRLHTLSGNDGLNSHFWNDSNHAIGTHNWGGASFGWYGELANYTDMLTVSFVPGGDGQGFWLNKDEESFGNYFVGLQMGNMDVDGEYNHLTLGYGYALEGANIGAVFNRQNISMTEGDVETSDAWNLFGVGVDYELNEETNVDAAFSFVTGSAKVEGGDEDVEDDGSGFAFGARAFYEWREDVTVVPVLAFASTEYSEGYKNTFIAAGLGFAYMVNEDNDVVFGLNFKSTKEETPASGLRQDAMEETETVLPGFYLGVEHEFTDWLTVRSAATKNWTKTDNGESGDALEESTTFPFGFSFGAGIALGDWQIDMGLNTEWLYNLGYWFHGNGASNEPIASLQAKLFF